MRRLLFISMAEARDFTAGLGKFGPVVEQPKKTSIHLVNKSAFAGAVTRGTALILNNNFTAPIRDARILHGERFSTNRFH